MCSRISTSWVSAGPEAISEPSLHLTQPHVGFEPKMKMTDGLLLQLQERKTASIHTPTWEEKEPPSSVSSLLQGASRCLGLLQQKFYGHYKPAVPLATMTACKHCLQTEKTKQKEKLLLFDFIFLKLFFCELVFK